MQWQSVDFFTFVWNLGMLLVKSAAIFYNFLTLHVGGVSVMGLCGGIGLVGYLSWGFLKNIFG